MATTRLIKHHISKGGTIAQSMKDRFDYGKAPEKSQDSELIRSYECDPETADAEFLLSKAKYKAITGREQKQDTDVLCYQIRQSFKRGEVDAETALNIGYDLAMRWTKGNHAFFVVSHIDRPHPHVHIYYNSTALDCTRKFRDFKGSAWALRRLSDRICMENRLSVILDAKPKSKGQFKHYGQWLGADKPPTYQERLKGAIDAALSEQPEDFDAFLDLMTAAGYEHKYGRGGVLSFRTEGQENYTRLRSSTLGDGYGLDDIRAAISDRAMPPVNRRTSPRKVNLIVDIQEKLNAGKGPGYEQWAKLYNLKQMAAALQYLQENDLLDYEDLEAKVEAATDRFHDLADRLKVTEAAIERNAGLRGAIVNYARTRPVFEEYKAKKYSNTYLAEHGDDIRAYRAAQSAMRDILQGEKLPKMDTLRAEWKTLTAERKSGYAEYRAAQKDMREVISIKHNIDHLLGYTDRDKNKEQTR